MTLGALWTIIYCLYMSEVIEKRAMYSYEKETKLQGLEVDGKDVKWRGNIIMIKEKFKYPLLLARVPLILTSNFL